MPIKPENRSRYPANWQTIREQILGRACMRCECCAAPQYGIGQWVDERFLLARGSAFYDQMQYALSYARAREAANHLNATEQPAVPYIVVVLTIAHLDHTPENCDPTNLRAWCQRCHLRYDAKHHAENAQRTRRARRAIGELFA
ncbi:hypothetical protein [Cupriavidus metallidurans]|uniref:hypothetical protein n=1 Tax=Cupriavidus metallidurans TaxID=119219 RepID=UPI000CE02563|nr:hypothetical protein [Cupriavidus metallidurans]AVA32977.1 hypothetical protein C3Z06_04645 [Cupriavidus metallidurans]